MKLLLIGNGRWGKKVAGALGKGVPSKEVKIVSSREFCESPDSRLLSEEDVVWITSRPQDQGKILNLLESFGGLVVLEKPMGLTSADFTNIKKSRIYETERLRLSRVWNYSPIWRTFLTYRAWDCNRIVIKRGGPNQGSHIPLHKDWLPHDLYLLTSLFGKELLNAIVLKKEQSSDLLKAQIMLGGKSTLIDIEVGDMGQKRLALWELYKENTCHATIDFTNKTLKLKSDDFVPVQSQADAIVSMVDNVNEVNFESVKLDLAVQEFFAKEFFSDFMP